MPVTLAPVDTTKTVDVPTMDDYNALAARVALLEGAAGSPPVTTPPTPPTPPTPAAESPDGTKITPGAGSVVDSHGAVWTLAANTNILMNGAPPPGWGWQSHELVYHVHAVNILGLDGNWYQWNGTAFVKGVKPPGA